MPPPQAVFFFVVGIDIKKEFVYGSLASMRQALLPCVGALGGMVVPMAVYLALNASGAAGSTMAGWCAAGRSRRPPFLPCSVGVV